ncbi:hypothetical protein GCM10008018_62270 [Paenibacillus marchantiophytorum]|uniref:Uncharacterized protein n=1 Tax=Paenibacillus marchantiophytorum TaxID=1619310 RepID=A0ABQ1FDJ1_9BACL|nr:hypothetical protein GCM10008018_62270 [Paenibacillus marchantiophytorum]
MVNKVAESVISSMEPSMEGALSHMADNGWDVGLSEKGTSLYRTYETPLRYAEFLWKK